jgi:hypothetical protein
VTVLEELTILYPAPAFILSDKGPEFIAQALRGWCEASGTTTAYIEPGSTWENGFAESFDGRFRDEFLNTELFTTAPEAQILADRRRWEHNTLRPHSALQGRTPDVVPGNQSTVNESPHQARLGRGLHHETNPPHALGDHPQAKTAEQLIAQGKTVADVCRAIEVTQPTYHRWKQQYRGTKGEEAKRLIQLRTPGSSHRLLRRSRGLWPRLSLKDTCSGSCPRETSEPGTPTQGC